jgi:hypothetical protein
MDAARSNCTPGLTCSKVIRPALAEAHSVLDEFNRLVRADVPADPHEIEETELGPFSGARCDAMRLTTEQSYAMLERFGCNVKDVCDRCGHVLGTSELCPPR